MGCVPPCRQQVRGSAPWPRGLAGVRDGLFPFTKGSSLLSLAGFKCPICSKSVASDEMEMHFIMCLSKPRLSYNGKGWQPGAAGGTAPRCLGTQTLASGGAGRRLGQACQEGCAPAEPRSHRPARLPWHGSALLLLPLEPFVTPEGASLAGAGDASCRAAPPEGQCRAPLLRGGDEAYWAGRCSAGSCISRPLS